MTISSEFITLVKDPAVADKDRIFRTRELAGRMTSSIPNPQLAHELNQLLNDAYLNLQLANIVNDNAMIERCRRDCLELVARVEKEAAPAGTSSLANGKLAVS